MPNIFNGTSAPERLDGTSGDDELYGLGGNDELHGLAGDDLLDGGIGDDLLVGGDGVDTYVVDSSNDVIIENANEGWDTIVTDLGSYSIADIANVEGLQGGASDQVLIGNSLRNTIDGGAGTDVLIGGLGNDTYFVDSGSDVIVEHAGEGTDDVYTDLSSYSIASVADLENLNGGAGDQQLTGNSLNNAINGWGGADSMIGGTGNDTYFVDDAGDSVTEFAGEGSDVVIASTDFVLNEGASVEALRPHGGHLGTTNISLTGNELAQDVFGNNGDNTLSGGGGDDYILGLSGSDTLNGDAGNDYLRGGNGDDQLIGGDGNDTLSGEVGIDAMAGGLGNHLYRVDNALDVITEATGGGTDSLISTVSYALAADAEIESMRSSTHSTVAIDFTGNDFAQRIDGNDGINTLVGGGGSDYLVGYAGDDVLNGGAGIDVLRGGSGADQFRFDTLDGRDNIVDYAVGQDSIVLDQSVFDAFGATGILGSNEFATGTRAQDADDHIIYNPDTGFIYYDADGSGPEAQLYFAHVTAGTNLTHADFFIS